MVVPLMYLGRGFQPSSESILLHMASPGEVRTCVDPTPLLYLLLLVTRSHTFVRQPVGFKKTACASMKMVKSNFRQVMDS